MRTKEFIDVGRIKIIINIVESRIVNIFVDGGDFLFIEFIVFVRSIRFLERSEFLCCWMNFDIRTGSGQFFFLDLNGNDDDETRVSLYYKFHGIFSIAEAAIYVLRLGVG